MANKDHGILICLSDVHKYVSISSLQYKSKKMKYQSVLNRRPLRDQINHIVTNCIRMWAFLQLVLDFVAQGFLKEFKGFHKGQSEAS